MIFVSAYLCLSAHVVNHEIIESSETLFFNLILNAISTLIF